MTKLVISGTAKTYSEKLAALDADTLAKVEAIKEAILAKDKKVHERISKKCATYKRQVAFCDRSRRGRIREVSDKGFFR